MKNTIIYLGRKSSEVHLLINATVHRFTASSQTRFAIWWCKTSSNSLVRCGSEMRLELTDSYINCIDHALELHFVTCYVFGCTATNERR